MIVKRKIESEGVVWKENRHRNPSYLTLPPHMTDYVEANNVSLTYPVTTQALMLMLNALREFDLEMAIWLVGWFSGGNVSLRLIVLLYSKEAGNPWRLSEVRGF
jgi:hypothetical protein